VPRSGQPHIGIISREFSLNIKVSTFEKGHYSEFLKYWYFALNRGDRIMRGLKKKDIIHLVMDGWQVHNNFLTCQPDLNGNTPV
jgi:hypothetical protein